MRAAITTALLVCVVVAGFAQSPKCGVCDKRIEGKFFQTLDRAQGGEIPVCNDCASLETRCFACSLPVKPTPTATKLTDGRFLCPRDAKESIQQDEEAKKICLQTREELDRLYWRFLTFPVTNVALNVVDQFTLESLFKSPGYGRRCTAVFGATSTHEVADNTYVHTISILSSLSRRRLEAVAAHEFGHSWLNENLPAARKAALAPEAIEAFCEMLAYQWMDHQRAEFEKKTIKENPYTRGQLDAFLKADAIHGFNTVLEWLKSGAASKLDADDPDGVRSVRTNPTPTPPPVTGTIRQTASLPEKLELKGISSGRGRRFAIINERTFGVMDLARMQLAKTNLLIRCLEIRTNSVVIRIESTGEKEELFLLNQ